MGRLVAKGKNTILYKTHVRPDKQELSNEKCLLLSGCTEYFDEQKSSQGEKRGIDECQNIDTTAKRTKSDSVKCYISE